MVSDLMADFAVSGAVFGTLSALYFYPYVMLQVPFSAMLETFGTRILLSGFLLLSGFGSILFAHATSIELTYLGRFLIGFGASVGSSDRLPWPRNGFRRSVSPFWPAWRCSRE